MIRVTATNSALTRTAFPGVPELYRALEAGTGGPSRPFFYVSSSPWNLEGFLRGFITHREIPLGPLLLRDPEIYEQVVQAYPAPSPRPSPTPTTPNRPTPRRPPTSERIGPSPAGRVSR